MSSKKPLICKKCKVPLNNHAEKEDRTTGDILQVHTCPKCGNIQTRKTD